MKVMLVDDDPIFTFLFQKLLEQYPDANLEFENFPDGFNAVEFFRENKNNKISYPEVLFIDINMPLMNGWELIKAINEENLFGKEKVKMYIITSSISKADLNNSKQQINSIEYLTKPISHQELFSALNKTTHRIS
jgi:CheY-like chemotaxis protein